MSLSQLKQNRILVVEEDKSFLHMACRVLSREGYMVAQVTDGKACLDYLFDNEVDLLILNADSSGVSSMQVLSRLNELGIGFNFIVFSGTEKSALEYLKAGALDSVAKGDSFWERLLLSVNKSFRFITAIREKEQFREQLHMTESCFYNLFDRLPQVFFEVDRAGKLLFLNKAGFELSGLSGMDFRRGLHLEELIHEDSRELFRRDFAAFYHSGGYGSGEYSLRLKDGSSMLVRVEFDALSEKNSQGILRGLMIDMASDNGNAESRKTQNQLRRISENSMLWN
jgi:PAS domain S-box-containing protein